MKTLLNLLTFIAVFANAISAQAPVSNPGANLWDDEAFVKSFLGSYGFLAGYEPPISEEEKEALRSLIDLMKVSPTAAAQQLEPQINAETSAAFDFILANLYFQDSNLTKAERYYKTAIKKYPDFRRAWKNLGLVQVQGGDYESAIATISKAMDLGEVDGRAYGLLGYGYLTQERYYPAEVAYRQAILMQPEVKDWKVGLARCLLETSRYPDSIAIFDSLIKDEPSNSDYWLLQSNAYISSGKPLRAANNIEVVRRLGKADISILTLLGDIYMNNESPDLALDAYLGAVDIAGKESMDALVRAADLFTRSGNYDQAARMIETTRSKFDSNLDNTTELKLLTFEAKIARATGNDEAAAELLNKIVERDALNGEAIIELANHYADSGDMAKAINRFEQAQKIEAFERPALVAHAQALVRSGEYEDAIPLLRRALKLKSDNNLEEFTLRVERAVRNRS
ncbi:MAG: tetratricopeptide repeat protein [Verrucomicrobiota bacterium]